MVLLIRHVSRGYNQCFTTTIQSNGSDVYFTEIRNKYQIYIPLHNYTYLQLEPICGGKNGIVSDIKPENPIAKNIELLDQGDIDI